MRSTSCRSTTRPATTGFRPTPYGTSLPVCEWLLATPAAQPLTPGGRCSTRSIDSSQTANLVVNALGMAIENRQAKGVVIHSDHGTQYTSWAFTRQAIDSGLVPSMGSIGDCYDNGQMESLLARMQVELLNRKRWNTRLELANAIFEYLEIFHNRQRRHSSLGMLSPI